MQQLEQDYLIDISYPDTANGIGYDSVYSRRWRLSEMLALRDALAGWRKASAMLLADFIKDFGLKEMSIRVVGKRAIGYDQGMYDYDSNEILVAGTEEGSIDMRLFAHELAHAWERHDYDKDTGQWYWGGKFPSFRTTWFALAFGRFNSAPIGKGGWIGDGNGWSSYARGVLDGDVTKPWEDFAETAAHIVANTDIVRKDSARYRFMIALMPGLQ